MQPSTGETLDRPWLGRLAGELLPYLIALLLLGLLGWFIYGQWTAVHGIRVDAPSEQVVSMLPPPPPPPPPPPEPKEKPPEPTERPQPAPAEAPKAQQQAAPVSVNAPAQAGSDAFGIAAGSGGGIGAPGGTGTCLGANCGAGGGSGMSDAFYRRYLSAALQERVQADDRVNRQVFSADFTLTVGTDGRVSGVQFVGARGRNDDEMMKRVAAILAAVRGLDPPPSSMRFPQKITVRGRRAL